MNLMQIGWACLIIGNIYTANDKDNIARIWIGLGAVGIVAGIFID